jgi:hypothetical protein
MINSRAHVHLSNLRNRLQAVLRDRKLREKLYGCPDGEFRRIMQDIGLSVRDLRVLEYCHPGPEELMPRRLEQLRLDPAYVRFFRTSTYQDMQRVCASCKAWRRCARDLARGDVQSGLQSYCLNAPTIDVLLVE